MSADASKITITKLERDEDEDYWKCRISNGKQTLDAHCKYGSWMVNGKDGLMKDVMPGVAAKIQDKMRKEERAEKRQVAT